MLDVVLLKLLVMELSFRKVTLLFEEISGRIESSEIFAELINGLEIDNIKIIAKAGLNHRVAVVLRGKNLSDKISDTDPHMINQSVKKSNHLVDDEYAKFTASVINKLSDKAYRLFNKHPTNKEREKRGLPKVTDSLAEDGKFFTPFIPSTTLLPRILKFTQLLAWVLIFFVLILSIIQGFLSLTLKLFLSSKRDKKF